jgi:nucleoid DNA-binding protein
MDDKLRAGQGVNIKGFGAFTFDIETELPKISHGRQVDIAKGLGDVRGERKNIHHCKPRFVVDDKLQYHINRYHGKEQIVPPRSQKSIYQKGFRMVFVNPVPIASAAQMGPDVVKDCMNALFGAIEDLIRQDKDVSLQMGFANLRFTNRTLKVHFADYLSRELANKDMEKTMRRMNSPVATMWTTNTSDVFRKSAMGNLVQKPNRHVHEAMMQKTQALKLFSMDMSSSAVKK